MFNIHHSWKINFSFLTKTLATALVLSCVSVQLPAQVKESSSNGFLIQSSRQVECSAEDAYRFFVEDFANWYDASHSYTSKAENLTLDLDRHCMLERLPNDGFVRHMEIVFHQHGKILRMTGGLGPLQGMGVAGAMTFSFAEQEGKTKISMMYSVSGGDHLKLEKIAEPVNQVLGVQLDRFRDYCSGQKTNADSNN